MIITCDSLEVTVQVKENLCICFHMKYLGNLKNLLGLEVRYEDKDIILHQHKYYVELLNIFRMLDCKPAVTPTDNNVKLFVNGSRELEDSTMDRNILGNVIYLN